MANPCEIENQRYIGSLKDFIDARAALVLAGILLGNKTIPVEQITAMKKTESNIIRDSYSLSECQIRRR